MFQYDFGPPKHVLHLVWSVLGISTATKTALNVALYDFFDFGHKDVVTSALTLKVEQAQRWSADDHYQDNDDFMLQHYDDKKGNLECVIVFSLNSLK